MVAKCKIGILICDLFDLGRKSSTDTHLRGINCDQFLNNHDKIACLMLVGQAVQNAVQRCLSLLCWGRLTHEWRRVGMKAVSVELRKVDSGVLAWRGEDCHGQVMDESLARLERVRKTFLMFSIFVNSGRISIYIDIMGPVLELGVLKNNTFRGIKSSLRKWENYFNLMHFFIVLNELLFSIIDF